MLDDTTDERLVAHIAKHVERFKARLRELLPPDAYADLAPTLDKITTTTARDLRRVIGGGHEH
ncbi:hypothetical protein EJO68_04155 [Variovorax atrisoli]|uniref:hypothetical protein n=1 Tax=Variovorax atrisoli TaxID=3394203 RepID=UPI000F7E53F3|nr:hypothetical protein [Variovorax sp. 369]RTD98572.1 hypothetical protein EJO68_04155 [Variovorax sp. 369]